MPNNTDGNIDSQNQFAALESIHDDDRENKGTTIGANICDTYRKEASEFSQRRKS